MPEHFEAIVMGSGPAGIAAAIHCVQAGTRVLLVTGRPESPLPNNDEALQSIHPGVLSLLKQLKLEGPIADASRGIYTGIETNGSINPLSTVSGETWTGHHILPSRFETFALAAARQQGVDVLQGTKIERILHDGQRVTGISTADRQTLNCTYLVDATGRKRLAGKLLGLEELLLSPPLVAWTGNSPIPANGMAHLDTAIFEPKSDSWTWKAYSGSGFFTWTTLAFKQNAGQIRQRVPGRVQGADMQWRVFRPLVKPGLLLAGDAAGILDPAAGQGILNALMSGMMAAHTVVKCLQNPASNGDYLLQYDEWFITQFNNKVTMLKESYVKLGIRLH